MLKHLLAGTKWDVPCERCGVLLSKCQCPPPPEPAARKPEPPPRSKQELRVKVEKRPGGKKVTLVEGVTPAERDALLGRLKSLCGAGGTIKEGKLEVQGDQKAKVAGELETQGYKVRVL